MNLLSQRLKIGNKRGVHLNAIPGRSKYKFDVDRLSQIRKEMPQEFIETLLSEASFRFKIKFSDTDITILDAADQKILSGIAGDLNALLFQNTDIKLEKGIDTFGFGYPLLVRNDASDGTLTASPLVIWSLKIEKTKELNTWVIKKNQDDPIYLNEVLLNHIEGDIGVSINKIPSEMLEDNVLDKDELRQLYGNILDTISHMVNKDLTPDSGLFEFGVQEIPDKETLSQKASEGPFIHWGGLFSLFMTQRESIIKEYDKMMESAMLEIPGDSFENASFQPLSGVQTDPSQQGILNALKSKRNIVIQGPPGTGKSQTLSAIIVNALENGKRILVVCEKRTALEVIYSNLKQINLQGLSVIIRDVKKDRKNVVEIVRNLADSADSDNNVKPAAKTELQRVLDKCGNLITQINAGHRAAGDDILAERAWTEIVGEYLNVVKEVGSPSWDGKEPQGEFSFSSDEYERWLKITEEGEQLFLSFEGKDYGLHEANLIGDNPYDIEEKMRNDCSDYMRLIPELQEKNKEFLSQYEKSIEGILAQKAAIPESVISQMDDIFNRNQSNSDFYNFDKTGKLSYTVTSLFSKAKHQLLKEQQTFHDLYKELQAKCVGIPFIKTSLDEVLDISEIRKRTESIKGDINEWKTSWGSIKEKAISEIGKERNEFPYHVLPKYNAYEKAAQDAVKRLRVDGWMDNPPSESDSPVRMVKGVADFTEKMKQLKDEGQEEFLKFHAWVNFFHHLNPREKSYVQLLKKEQNWKASFFSHYLNKLLLKKAEKDLPTDDKNINNLSEALNNIGENQIEFILQYWKARQINSIVSFNEKNELKVNNLYNKRSSKYYKKNTLREIIKFDFELFGSFFPVVLTTPDACATAFQNMDEVFDIVLFDEASQLKVEDTLPALFKGKQKIVAGDEHQMPPSTYFGKMIDGEIEDDDVQEESEKQKITLQNVLLSTESLLDFASSLSFGQRHLDFHYRSKHPHLIEFSNAAFYKGRLCAMPALFDYKPLEFLHVGGTYKNNVNDDEAEAVIGILENNLECDELGHYPSVGIATFNVKQRDYILEKIRDHANSDKKFAAKLTGLEESGLFVKNLENIQGDERDIIILSTTYGPDEKGKFYQRFGPINLSKGYKLLNVIITRAKFKCYVCTSVPRNLYQGYRDALQDEGGNNRKAVFFSYLAYAEAVSEGNEQRREAVLSALREQAGSIAEGISISPSTAASSFEGFVKEHLEQKFPEDDIQIFESFAGFTLDLILRPKEEGVPPIIIECDGRQRSLGEEAYLHDIYRQAILEKYGLVFYRAWSTNWWRNHKREAKKLTDFILDIKKNRKDWKPLTDGLPFLTEDMAWFKASSAPEPLKGEESQTDAPVPEPVREEDLPHVIKEDSLVVLEHVASGKQITLQTNARSNPSDKDGVRTLDLESPLVQSMLGHAKGDIIKVGSLENYYEIIEVEE